VEAHLEPDNLSNLPAEGTESKCGKLVFDKLITNRPLSPETTRLVLPHLQNEVTVS